MCETVPGVCGVGRDCIDWKPPAMPSLYNAPVVTCSKCHPGYMNDSIGLSTYNLTEYEMVMQVSLPGSFMVTTTP